MSEIQIVFIEKENISTIIPLLKELNQSTSEETLKKRVLEMVEQNYKCLGIYSNNELIGICGLWFLTRHYCGKTVEPDHVYISDEYKSKGIGKQLFEWIFDYCQQNNLEATELNSYVNNPRSHKFYYNLGYEIKGFHFLKILE
ncbi:GNAT family N-acetyltransferase [Paracrocinitomix mangrovi]|uniref:GNAT family N-acetyltransferase n=1 Tax=Paracrocinitomix mangrovi TaxID=2862509 RepID=UPI001C8DE507|nr:GNAT family N-acetyltransferase [Paracrocinitomix mangrovi]UKN01765.1 GNAT family N-acetyltransferase [Paracrocinitomix mangrovi]